MDISHTVSTITSLICTIMARSVYMEQGHLAKEIGKTQ